MVLDRSPEVSDLLVSFLLVERRHLFEGGIGIATVGVFAWLRCPAELHVCPDILPHECIFLDLITDPIEVREDGAYRYSSESPQRIYSSDRTF